MASAVYTFRRSRDGADFTEYQTPTDLTRDIWRALEAHGSHLPQEILDIQQGDYIGKFLAVDEDNDEVWALVANPNYTGGTITDANPDRIFVKVSENTAITHFYRENEYLQDDFVIHNGNIYKARQDIQRPTAGGIGNITYQIPGVSAQWELFDPGSFVYQTTNTYAPGDIVVDYDSDIGIHKFYLNLTGTHDPSSSPSEDTANWADYFTQIHKVGINGIGEWDATRDYDIGDKVIGDDGIIYIANAVSGATAPLNPVDPLTDNAQTFWQPAATDANQDFTTLNDLSKIYF